MAEVIVFAAVGDGFEVFGISPVGDADAGDLTLLCKFLSVHIHRSFFCRKTENMQVYKDLPSVI